ncbi:MAG: hypothetical protein NTW27_01185, partial [Deltaproteobacteria bacterium]|nr:hypothetical protein [Deltaproteobacteria bacterium]
FVVIPASEGPAKIRTFRFAPHNPDAITGHEQARMKLSDGIELNCNAFSSIIRKIRGYFQPV